MLRSTLSSSLSLALLGALGLAPAACGGDSSGSGNSTNPPPSCTAPVIDASTTTCQEGYTYRQKSPTCSNAAADAAAPAPGSLPRADGSVNCTSDASVCAAYAYGYCASLQPIPGKSVCLSGCGSDADCAEGGRCDCSGNSGQGACLYDDCYSDSECEPGYHCASTAAGCGNSRFVCQTAEDTCVGQKDCPAGQFCVVQNGQRHCGSGSVCGRPFLVLGEGRVAQAVTSNAWLIETTMPQLAGLSEAERSARADHFTRMGQLEHGSIAAFARFQLQLLSLGAPPELVDACTQALADETAHARLCFTLASAYAGRNIGPGPLDVSSSLCATSLLEVVDLVLDEGCFGEAGAALEALEAAELETDPVLVAAYRRIAADEQRHAELAFRFVRWALERGGDPVAERIRAAVETPPAANAAAHGVTLPCLRALLKPQALAAARAPANQPVI